MNQDKIRITLALPPKELSPNARVHWAKKSRAVRAYRALAMAVARGYFAGNDPPRLTQAKCQATFFHKDRRRRDPDNLLSSLKQVWDGFVDAKIFKDDDQLTHLPIIKRIDKDNPRLEIEIEGI